MGTLCHFSASFRATAAGIRALSTMVHVRCVFFALSRAGLADVGAKLTDIGGMGATTRHERNSRVTNPGAVPVKLNTAYHHLYVLFRKTRFSAGVAANGAVLTGVNAILILLGG